MSIVGLVLLAGTVVAVLISRSHGADRAGVRLGTVWANGQSGFGEVEPTYISNGGDPTGIVEDVKWTGWGTDIAIGSGFSYYAQDSVADSNREPVVVVAFDLGVCNGKTGYQGVVWYYPQHGQEFDPSSTYDICSTELLE